MDAGQPQVADAVRPRRVGALAAWLAVVALLTVLGCAGGGVDEADRGEIIYRGKPGDTYPPEVMKVITGGA